jgi:hypothetical protein
VALNTFLYGKGNENHELDISYWWKNQRERDHEEDQDIGGWIIILRWILGRGVD